MSVSEGCQQAHSQNSAKTVVVQSVLAVYKSNDKIFKWKGDLCRFLKDITFAIQFPQKYSKKRLNVDVVVNFLSQVIFVFVLFLGMVMYANEVETKEK